MSEPVRRFMASDATVYVDTYRRLILNTRGEITDSQQNLEQRMREMNLVPPRLYAELRAHEHALTYVTEKTDPGMVILGDPVEEASAATSQGQQINTLEESVRDLQMKLKQAAEKQHELEAELVTRSEENSALHRKLAHTYNSVAIGGFASVLALLALLGIIFLRSP